MQKKQVIQAGLMVCIMAGFSGCANTVNYSKAIHSWNGVSEHELFAAWGPPTEVKQLKNGGHVDIYHVTEPNRERKGVYWDSSPFVRVTPQSTSGVLSHTNPMNRRAAVFYCNTLFTVNKASIIVNSYFGGNNCVATKEKVMRQLNR